MDGRHPRKPASKKTALQQPTHAYIIAYFKDDDGSIKIVSGRERALHEKAITELEPRYCDKIIAGLNKKETIFDETGGNFEFNIFRNFSGVLLCGRTALPGGKIDRQEKPEQAAIREFEEEFGFNGVTARQLAHLKTYPLDKKRCEIYYLLDLDAAKIKPQQIIESFDQNPTTEKRLLEILTLDELIAKLDAPDEADKTYIKPEMAKFAGIFCRKLEELSENGSCVTKEAEEKFAQDLYEYQIQRKFYNVVAAREFKKRIENKTSVKDQAGQILMPPPRAEAPKIAPQKQSRGTIPYSPARK